MSIEKRSDLFREYARVIDMCEGTGVDPYECVGCGMSLYVDEPPFMSDPGNYTFAVAILEDEPLFVGDKVYWKHDGSEFEWGIVNHRLFSWGNDLTRTPPKRTFKLAGRELSLPSETETQCNAYIGSAPYYFDDPADSYAFEDALNAIIREAIENERLQNK